VKSYLTRHVRSYADTTAIRTVFARPDDQHVTNEFDTIAAMLGRQLLEVEQMMHDAEGDLIPCTALPVAHWKEIRSNHPLERLNKEVKATRRRDGSSPSLEAPLRLAVEVLVERTANDSRRKRG
jgi:putative transposase